MREAVIVAYGRSAVGKAPKGSLSLARPEIFGAEVLKGVLAKVPQLDPSEIEDVIVGCAFPEAEQGLNLAKSVAVGAGLPNSVAAQTINRFCSSGVQSIATAANSIVAGDIDVAVAGGVESMSRIPMGGLMLAPAPSLIDSRADFYVTMGTTAENVAEKYGVTKEMQNTFSEKSHAKAAKAQAEGKFNDEIIPVTGVKTYVDEQGITRAKTFQFMKDEGIRPGVTAADIGKLKPVFKANGTVTAGNASQMSDGAAFVVLMEREKAEKLGIKPIAKLRSFAVAGVDPDIMGIGPMVAIPKALKKAGLKKEEIDLIELNEAFASQSIACINELGLDEEKINVNGGAIALGHPLGCTGGFLTAKLLSELKRRNEKYGIVSMCIGGGMGAAAVYERL